LHPRCGQAGHGGQKWRRPVVFSRGIWLSALRPRPVDVEVARVVRGHFAVGIEDEGKTRVRERCTIAAPVARTLMRIGLKAGIAVGVGMAVVSILPNVAPLFDAEESLRTVIPANITGYTLGLCRGLDQRDGPDGGGRAGTADPLPPGPDHQSHRRMSMFDIVQDDGLVRTRRTIATAHPGAA
jgi:hypothetical protein